MAEPELVAVTVAEIVFVTVFDTVFVTVTETEFEFVLDTDWALVNAKRPRTKTSATRNLIVLCGRNEKIFNKRKIRRGEKNN